MFILFLIVIAKDTICEDQIPETVICKPYPLTGQPLSCDDIPMGAEHFNVSISTICQKPISEFDCWGLAKAYDRNGLHDGFIIGCGNGIEECPVSGFSNAAKQWCQSDPRKAWRSLLVKANLEGNIVWYRQDNFWSGEENPVTSASEYVITTGNAIVSVNDELFGVGLQRVE